MHILTFGLTILFVGLKLLHQIDWSWWWIVSPVPIAFILAFCLQAAYLIYVIKFGSERDKLNLKLKGLIK